eukprot:654150-Rhodomonas_salina.2
MGGEEGSEADHGEGAFEHRGVEEHFQERNQPASEHQHRLPVLPLRLAHLGSGLAWRGGSGRGARGGRGQGPRSGRGRSPTASRHTRCAGCFGSCASAPPATASAACLPASPLVTAAPGPRPHARGAERRPRMMTTM